MKKRKFIWTHEGGMSNRLLDDRLPADHAHIVIRSIGRDVCKVPCRNPAIYLEFHDLDDRSPGDYHAGLFQEKHARRIVNFLEALKGRSLIVVNCEAGVSRSPGVVLALRRHYGGDTEEIFKRAIPNIYVTNILSRALRESEARVSD